MNLKRVFEMLLVAGVLSLPASAADPEFDPGQLQDASVVLEKARELRKLSDQGDAGATYQLALLVAHLMSGKGPALNEKEAAEFRELSERKYGSLWMMKAAEMGSQPAIEVVCRIGQDPLAPARLREQGKARCDELRAKHPAQ